MKTPSAPHPGEPRALEGLSAALAMENLAGSTVAMHPDRAFAALAGPLGRLLPAAGAAPLSLAPERLPGLLAGLAASGRRGAGFVAEPGALDRGLEALAGQRLACVVHLCARAIRRQASALAGGHDACYAAADAGAFQLVAADVQQAADFTLIARRVAELALTPGCLVQDYYATGQSVANLNLPEPALINAFLGRPGDRIESPTPAQRMLFGDHRRRLPRLADIDQPAGLGGYQDADSFFRATAAGQPFFAAHLGPLLEQAMTEFARLSGRRHAPLAAYRCDDAEVLVLAVGALVEPLKAAADYLRATERIRVGVLAPGVLRPFPAAELSHALESRRALTVLESSDAALAGDGPLMREVRAAIDRAVENGASAKNAQPWPRYARYRRRGDRPAVFAGSYGVGTAAPSFSELCAAIRNMRPGGARRRRFYLGLGLERERERLPQLQVIEHRLRDGYPDLERLSLPAAEIEPGALPAATLELDAAALQGGLYAGNLLAQALHAALGGHIRTWPQGGLEPALRASRLTLVHGDGDCRACPETAAVLLVAGAARVAVLDPARIARGGTLVVASDRDGEDLWQDWAGPVERWIREREVRVVIVPARPIAAESDPPAALVEPLALWALIGAGLGAEPRYAAAPEEIRARLDELLAAALGPDQPLAGQIVRCLRAGAERSAEIDWRSRPPQARRRLREPPPPWTVPADESGAPPLFDRGRFWHSVSFLYDRARPEDALIDPFLATALMPAATSAPRDMTRHRRRLPQWLPENCTGCGLCWALCPDSALPPAVIDPATLIGTAMAAARGPDRPLTQLARIADHLAKQAQRIVAADGLGRYRTAGALLGEAFERLLAKLTLDGDAEAALRVDLAALRAPLEDLPLARTEAFFDRGERECKGGGKLLTIGLNTASCKACGVCVESCPDAAFAWTAQKPATVDQARRNWGFQHRLPEIDPAPHLRAGEAASEVNRLLADGVYHCLSGGDGARPGDGSKTAVHLVLAAVESVMRPRHRAHAARLAELADGLRAKIQGQVSAAVTINDFEEFAARLGRLDQRAAGPADLTALVGDEDAARGVDAARLARLSRLLAELERQRQRYATGRARAMLVLADGEVLRWSGTYPDNPHANPWIGASRGAAAGTARGLIEGMTERLGHELAACRLAAAELADRAGPADHQRLAEGLNWDELEPAEQALLPPVLVIAPRATTTWAEVAELLAGAGPILTAILDPEAIVLPPASCEHHALLALDLADAFVLQTSVGHPGHLIGGVVEALAAPRPALIQVFAPDLEASGVAPEKMAEHARGAFESRALPLFRFDPREPAAGLSLAENPAPGNDWSRRELRVMEPDGERKVDRALTVADWALGQERFRPQFEIVARGRAGEQARPLADWLALAPDARRDLTPYVHVTDAAGRLFVARVSAPLAAATEACQRVWTRLRQRAGATRPAAADRPAATAAAPAPEPTTPAPAPDEHARLTERLLELCGYREDPDFFNRSLRRYLEQHRPEPETTPDEPAR